MKKILASILILGLTTLTIKTAYAGTDAETAPVSITVNPSFSLTLGGQAELMLGNRNAGIYSKPITLTVNNNHGIEWTVSLHAATLSDGAGHSFPANKFRYAIDGGAGVKVPSSGEANIPTSATTIYTAAASEYSVNGFGLGMFIIVEVAPDQTAADYSTTLNLTLTDAS